MPTHVIRQEDAGGTFGTNLSSTAEQFDAGGG